MYTVNHVSCGVLFEISKLLFEWEFWQLVGQRLQRQMRQNKKSLKSHATEHHLDPFPYKKSCIYNWYIADIIYSVHQTRYRGASNKPARSLHADKLPGTLGRRICPISNQPQVGCYCDSGFSPKNNHVIDLILFDTGEKAHADESSDECDILAQDLLVDYFNGVSWLDCCQYMSEKNWEPRPSLPNMLPKQLKEFARCGKTDAWICLSAQKLFCAFCADFPIIMTHVLQSM